MIVAKSRLVAALMPFAVVAVLCTAPAWMQPAAAQPFGPGMMMGPGMMDWPMMGRTICDPRAAGLAEWRMQRVEQRVRPTDAQRPALEELAAASKKAAETIAAACPKELPQSPPARLEVMEKRLDAMLQAVKIVRPAFEKFYTSLSKEQQERLEDIGPRQWGWRHWHWPWI
jgi:LTXXQ motif family protein